MASLLAWLPVSSRLSSFGGLVHLLRLLLRELLRLLVLLLLLAEHPVFFAAALQCFPLAVLVLVDGVAELDIAVILRGFGRHLVRGDYQSTPDAVRLIRLHVLGVDDLRLGLLGLLRGHWRLGLLR